MSNALIRVELWKGLPDGAAKCLRVATSDGVYRVSAQGIRRVLEHRVISTVGFRTAVRVPRIEGKWARDVDLWAFLGDQPSAPAVATRDAYDNLMARWRAGQKRARIIVQTIDEEESDDAE